MNTITAKPTTVGEMLNEEFLKSMNITQQQINDPDGEFSPTKIVNVTFY
ncbi:MULTISPECIES: hypothetical protein [Photorhabdus]|nr:hypothetical protein [Photorhabdus thracensis]